MTWNGPVFGLIGVEAATLALHNLVPNGDKLISAIRCIGALVWVSSYLGCMGVLARQSSGVRARHGDKRQEHCDETANRLGRVSLRAVMPRWSVGWCSPRLLRAVMYRGQGHSTCDVGLLDCVDGRRALELVCCRAVVR